MSDADATNLATDFDTARPAGRLRSYARVFVTLFDQGIVSIATYLTAVLVSRATTDGFGLYTLVFTLWIFGGEAHNSLVSTPQMLRLPRLKRVAAQRFNGSLLLHQFALSGVLVVGLAIVSAILFALVTNGHDHLRGHALVTLMAAVSLGPIALRNFARNACFALRDATSALALDVGVSIIQVGGVAMVFAHGELHHWWLAVLIAAAANLFSSVLWLSMARGHFAPHFRRAVVDLRRNWRTSRYIFVSSMLWTAGMYSYPWLVYAIAGDRAAGIWGACFTLANLGNPLVMGIQNIMGPSIAYAHAHRSADAFRRYVFTCSAFFVVLVLPASVVLAFVAERLLTLFNGDAYVGNGRVTAILAFTMLLQGLSFPTSRGLFSLGRAKLDMLANVGPLIVLAVIGPFLIGRYGVVGAAWCLIASQAVGTATRAIAFFRLQPSRGRVDESSIAAAAAATRAEATTA